MLLDRLNKYDWFQLVKIISTVEPIDTGPKYHTLEAWVESYAIRL